MALDCSPGTHPVASIIRDSHGRTSFDVIYNSFADFWKDYKLWLEMNKETNTIISYDDESEYPETYFYSRYIRNKINLSVEYG
jgi:hypothetical protein